MRKGTCKWPNTKTTGATTTGRTTIPSALSEQNSGIRMIENKPPGNGTSGPANDPIARKPSRMTSGQMTTNNQDSDFHDQRAGDKRTAPLGQALKNTWYHNSRTSLCGRLPHGNFKSEESHPSENLYADRMCAERTSLWRTIPASDFGLFFSTTSK